MGRAHGLDGSFYVEDAAVELLAEGSVIAVGGREAEVVRRAGTDARPLVRVDGVEDRDAAKALRGEELRAAVDDASGSDAGAGEWDVDELVGCDVPGIGTVRRVVAAPSCDLLEVGDDAVLVPLVSDAVKRVDPGAGVIEVDLRFLGLAP
ncbi:MAG: rRNA processing protein RimM [Thermoleophilaceae bacterium]|nr:rRNA processing protein RimM [Thermoleophilaceae bacterium]